MFVRLALALLVALSLPHALAEAQIVNVLPRGGTAEDGVSGSVELPIEWRTGNTDLIRGGLRSHVLWTGLPHQFLAIAEGDIGLQDGERYLTRHFEHLRYRFFLSERWAWESFVQHAYDEQGRINLRALLGSGPRVYLVRTEGTQLSVGNALMGEWARFSEPLSNGDTERQLLRSSHYLRWVVSLDPALQLATTVFVQPALTQRGDVRIAGDATLRTSFGAFFLQQAFKVVYDSDRPTGVEPTDTELVGSIGLRF